MSTEFPFQRIVEQRPFLRQEVQRCLACRSRLLLLASIVSLISVVALPRSWAADHTNGTFEDTSRSVLMRLVGMLGEEQFTPQEDANFVSRQLVVRGDISIGEELGGGAALLGCSALLQVPSTSKELAALGGIVLQTLRDSGLLVPSELARMTPIVKSFLVVPATGKSAVGAVLRLDEKISRAERTRATGYVVEVALRPTNSAGYFFEDPSHIFRLTHDSPRAAGGRGAHRRHPIVLMERRQHGSTVKMPTSLAPAR